MHWKLLAAFTLCLAPGTPAAAQSAGDRPPSAAAQSPRAQVEVARTLLAQRRFPEAEAQLKAFLQRSAGDTDAWNLLGVIQFSQKNYHDSANSFGRATQFGEAPVDLLTNWGAALLLSERLADARAALSRAVKLDAENSRAHMLLGRVAVFENDIATAEREFRAAIKPVQVDSGALLHYGVFLFQERRLAEARAMLERCVMLDPTMAVAHNYLGLTLQRLGETAGAQEHLRRFREMTEIEVGEQRMLMRVSSALRAAQREIADGNLEAALSAALDAVEHGAQFPVVHQTLADVYRRMGRTAEADAALAQAQELSKAASQAAGDGAAKQ